MTPDSPEVAEKRAAYADACQRLYEARIGGADQPEVVRLDDAAFAARGLYRAALRAQEERGQEEEAVGAVAGAMIRGCLIYDIQSAHQFPPYPMKLDKEAAESLLRAIRAAGFRVVKDTPS